MASHIVGGEFELLYIEGSRYRLNLILYFDVNNGNPLAKDPDVTVRFFRKSDNLPMMDIFMPFTQEFRVDYFQPLCSEGEIVTDKLIYSTEITLSAAIFNDPGGYYVSWERCCRNYSITNIFSENPQQGGVITAGQTFYLEFPAVVKNGQPFINSSPQLFPPLNDYACPNRPYWVDFAGIDVDGDSLVYSLITPLNTLTSQAIPLGGPGPGPYPIVRWRQGFGLDKIMGNPPGIPDLTISDQGFLTATPTNPGLFVFAVKCEEFRDGVKIGELIRDFQMLVLGSCPVAEPPEIYGKTLGEVNFDNIDTMSVIFTNATPDANRCINVQVTDPDALNAESGFSENLRLELIAIGFETEIDLTQLLPDISTATLENGSIESFKLCFGPCPLVLGSPYTIGIIVFDDACALPLSDTLRLTIDIEPPDNSAAYFLTNDALMSVKEGDDYQLAIQGKDDDSDSLIVDIITDGFDLADFGMSFDNTVNVLGDYTTTFNWATGCDIYDFTQRTNFLIKVVLNDADLCDYGEPDTLTLDLAVILPPNTDPIISTDLSQITFLHRINAPINFNVFGLDNDGDDLELRIWTSGFELRNHDISFANVDGGPQIQSNFSWDPGCENVNLDDNREFTFYFILNDLDKCKFSNHDSLEVNITLLPPLNNAPDITFVNLNPETEFQPNEANLVAGQLLKLDVIAADRENNMVELKLLTATELPNGASFEAVTGAETVSSVLEWNTGCMNLDEDFQPKSYTIQFLAGDDACFNSQADTVSLVVNLVDVEPGNTEFEPANVFTPNKDGVNDTYSLPDLPVDDCTGQFESFRVFNRWGTEVYVTIERDFNWEAKGLRSGVYYYVVAYSNKEFSGTLSILY